MTQALTEREPTAPVVTADQLDLIKRTVASGASDAELKLYLFDCARQGVHPLDKLLHFTKRGGKYTPVTSIDLMRSRAADTDEYAGNDDAVFLTVNGRPESATVTVWRFVKGERCAFSATARWDEYYPGEQSGSMWRKMPHTMLGKCAEALALRKGFPRQLAGLYASEELDQAQRSEPISQTHGSAAIDTVDANVYAPAGLSGDDLPAGVVYLTKVAPGMGKAKAFVSYTGQGVTEDALPIYSNHEQAETWCREGVAVKVQKKESASGRTYINKIEPAQAKPMPVADSLLVDDEAPF